MLDLVNLIGLVLLGTIVKVGGDWYLEKYQSKTDRLLYKVTLLDLANEATDLVFDWEDAHSDPWIDGYCEHYRTLVLEAIVACQKVAKEMAEMTDSMNEIIDFLQARLEPYTEPPPNETSHEVSFFIEGGHLVFWQVYIQAEVSI